MYTGPYFEDGGPKKELSERSSSSLEESTSFEIPALFLPEVGMRLDDVVEKKDIDDENYEEPSSVNSNPGSALDELPKWLSTLQIVDAATLRQQKACEDETQEKQSFTDLDDDDGV